MENVNSFKEREIASYSIRTDAGRLFFDLKWGDRENFLQITQSKKKKVNYQCQLTNHPALSFSLAIWISS